MLQGAEVVFGSVKDKDSIREKAFAGKVDVVVSCLASRTGGIKDSWEIDYEATKNVMVRLSLAPTPPPPAVPSRSAPMGLGSLGRCCCCCGCGWWHGASAALGLFCRYCCECGLCDTVSSRRRRRG
jgi:hypothetical protein